MLRRMFRDKWEKLSEKFRKLLIKNLVQFKCILKFIFRKPDGQHPAGEVSIDGKKTLNSIVKKLNTNKWK